MTPRVVVAVVAVVAAPACTACTTAPASCRAPRPLVELNAAGDDRSPYLAGDGLELWFSSDRGGNVDLYRATRGRRGDPFAPPELAAAVSSADVDTDPFVTDDGLELWFWRGQTGTWHARRPSRDGAFDPPAVEPSIAGRHPSFTADRLTVYTASLHLTPTEDIYVATRASLAEPFGAPQIALSADPYADQGPSISGDGATLLFGTGALASDHALRVARARRTATGFAPPTLVDELAPVAGSDDRDPQRARDGGAIVFASNRPGGAGGLDLWIACD